MTMKRSTKNSMRAGGDGDDDAKAKAAAENAKSKISFVAAGANPKADEANAAYEKARDAAAANSAAIGKKISPDK